MWLWIQMYISLCKSLSTVLFGGYPEVQLLDYVVILLFLKNCPIVFPQWLYRFTLLQQSPRVPVFPDAHQHLFFFLSSHPDGCRVASHCSFDLHFPVMSGGEHLFMGSLSFSEKCLFKSLEDLSFYKPWNLDDLHRFLKMSSENGTQRQFLVPRAQEYHSVL
jgi:hypothetical protein